MHKIRKLLILILLTMILGGIALIMNRYDKKAVDSQLADLLLPGGEKISPWTSDKDGISYYFIPSYVDFDDICISLREDNEIRIDNQVFNDGDRIVGLKVDQIYNMYDKKNTMHNIKFLQSGNVSTVFVTTVTGSMNAIYQSKKNKEAAKITVIDKDGNVDLIRTDSKIKGRGNATWNKEKKPFSILFNEPESILGMEVSSKWVLLANAFDDTEIRNAIVMDIAKKVGLTETSDYKYVDLYLNGEYNGLYMLCQSIDTITERLDADEEDVFLFSAEIPERISKMNQIIYADDNKALIDVSIPTKPNSEEKETAEKIIAKMDTVIANRENTIGDVIDIDSWVKKYLIDEIFENYDSGLTSAYFYTTSKNIDAKVYGGPIWDYDFSLGNKVFDGPTRNPEILFAMQEYRSKTHKVLWYSKLYSNPVFYNEIVKTFENDFLPLLEELAENGIIVLAQEISDAKVIDDVRWEKKPEEGFDNEYEFLVNYISKRIGFLKSIWLDNAEYVNVSYFKTIGDDSFYIRVYISKGSALSDNPEIMTKFNRYDKWYIEGTNEEYDFDLPVYENIVLENISDKQATGIKAMLKKESKVLEIGISLLALPFVIVFVQISRRYRRGAV